MSSSPTFKFPLRKAGRITESRKRMSGEQYRWVNQRQLGFSEEVCTHFCLEELNQNVQK